MLQVRERGAQWQALNSRHEALREITIPTRRWETRGQFCSLSCAFERRQRMSSPPTLPRAHARPQKSEARAAQVIAVDVRWPQHRRRCAGRRRAAAAAADTALTQGRRVQCSCRRRATRCNYWGSCSRASSSSLWPRASSRTRAPTRIDTQVKYIGSGRNRGIAEEAWRVFWESVQIDIAPEWMEHGTV